jgi:hypothetical protein
MGPSLRRIPMGMQEEDFPRQIPTGKEVEEEFDFFS